jgi:hypothetical protein
MRLLGGEARRICSSTEHATEGAETEGTSRLSERLGKGFNLVYRQTPKYRESVVPGIGCWDSTKIVKLGRYTGCVIV